MWDGEVFLTSNSSNPAASTAALMLRFMYSGMYGSVEKKKTKKKRRTGAGAKKRGIQKCAKTKKRRRGGGAKGVYLY